jgi:hypothetical protein
MARGRAYRRFRLELKKRRARDYHGGLSGGIFLGGLTPRVIGMRAATPKCCSCRGCGNPRRHHGGPTRQEARAAVPSGW